MDGQVTASSEKPILNGIEIIKALLERQRFISNHLSKGSSILEPKEMRFKIEKADLSKDTMETQTVTATQPPEHKGIALFKKAQAKKKFVTEHLAKGGTVEELRQLGFKFGTLDLHNLTSKRP